MTRGLALLESGQFKRPQNDNGYILKGTFENGNLLIRPWRKLKKPYLAEIEIHNNMINILRWIRVPKRTHHWAETFKERIYQPSRQKMKTTDDLVQSINPIFKKCKPRNINADTVVVLDKFTGKTLKEFNILEKIEEAKEAFPRIGNKITYCDDPLHINDAQPLRSRAQASLFKDGKIGDIIVSIRNISSIILIDKDSGRIKWHLDGIPHEEFHKKAQPKILFNGITNWSPDEIEDAMFYMQHSPRLTSRGTMLIFDNLGSDTKFGRSRVVEIDIDTKKIIGKYEGTKDDYFSSHQRGRIEILNDEQFFIQEQFYNDRQANTAFILTCKRRVISKDCTREDLFTVSLPKHYYNNAHILKTYKFEHNTHLIKNMNYSIII